MHACLHASVHVHYFLACLGLNLIQIGLPQRDQSIYGIKEHAGPVWAHNVTWACKLVCMHTMWLLVILISFICARLWIEMLNWPIWTKIWFQSKSLRKSLVPLRLRQNPSYSWADSYSHRDTPAQALVFSVLSCYFLVSTQMRLAKFSWMSQFGLRPIPMEKLLFGPCQGPFWTILGLCLAQL